MRTVVLVDDHEVFRRFARRLLIAAGYDVVGEAATARAGLAAARWFGPDVIVLDILLPDGTGFDVAEQLAADAERPFIVLVSSRPAADWGRELAASPADVFVGKDQLSVDVLSEAIG